MKIMGLPNWLHWTAWFMKTFMFMMISVILIVILTTVQWYPDNDVAVFTFSDPSLLLVFFIVYVIASICFFFLISVLFSKGIYCIMFFSVFVGISHACLFNNHSKHISSRIPFIKYPHLLAYHIFCFIAQYL
jgi:hypothetical protein